MNIKLALSTLSMAHNSTSPKIILSIIIKSQSTAILCSANYVTTASSPQPATQTVAFSCDRLTILVPIVYIVGFSLKRNRDGFRSFEISLTGSIATAKKDHGSCSKESEDSSPARLDQDLPHRRYPHHRLRPRRDPTSDNRGFLLMAPPSASADASFHAAFRRRDDWRLERRATKMATPNQGRTNRCVI